MSEFNFKWYNGKVKIRKKYDYKDYQHNYYMTVTKPKRQKERERKQNIDRTNETCI